MAKSMIAPQNKRTYSSDVIFGANGLAQEAIKKYGRENVISATIGAILDEDEHHVFLKTVEDEYKNMPSSEISQYAPIAGLPAFLDAVQQQCFGESKPDAYIRAISIAGGTGGIHHLVHIYTEPGDEVITSDWHWGAYGGLCSDNQRSLTTYPLLTDSQTFNLDGLKETVERLAKKQRNILIIINTPAHNPTGYSISETEWDSILSYFKEVVARGKNHIIIGLDVAYIDYAGEKEDVRKMFKKFSHLPAEILTAVIYSASKGYTLYGQRVGALIGISSDEDVANEFFNACEFTSRGTWSNSNRAAMYALARINEDSKKQAKYEEERNQYYHLIKERAEIFMSEARACGLYILPYHGGFFISIPTDKAMAICEELHKENIFLVPLKKGIRIAVCAVPKHKITGLALKIKEAMNRIEA